MAGQGPVPAENRRRRNEPARGDWVDLEPLTKPVLPKLPRNTPYRDEDGKLIPWPARTKTVWESWRSDPVTGQYSPADIEYALDTILLHAFMKPSSASEVRLRMDALGLTPKGKRDLRWRVPEGEAPETAKKPTARRKKNNNRRARLSVVK